MSEGYLIAIDGGTTNTRIRLLRLHDLSILATTRKDIGAKDTITKGRESLENAVAQGITEVLEKSKVQPEEVVRVVASGMITSEAGLLEVPHVIAPAGLEEIARGTIEKRFKRIWSEPITFIPGVKTLTSGSIALQDIMRGEECESLGIMKLTDVKGPALIVLPGSHTKFVFVDESNRIEASLTTIAGELASATVSSTLIGRSLESVGVESIDGEFLIEGYKNSRRYGLTRSLFIIRLLHLLRQGDTNQRRNFLWGALIGTDLMSLESDPRFLKLSEKGRELRILVGGGDPLREMFGKLIETWAYERFPEAKVIALTTDLAERASAIGAAMVALKANELKSYPHQTS